MTKIIVVGSGVIGLSCALFLALEGYSVRVITRNPEEATSWVAGGMLAPFSEGLEGVLFEFSYESLREYPSFVDLVKDASGQKVDLWMDGINRVILKGEEKLLEKAEAYAKMGFRVEMLDRLPYLSRKVQTVIHYPEEGWVDAEMLMDALLFAVNRLGIEIAIDHIVKIDTKDKKVISLEGLKGRYEADFYLFCIGAWTRTLFDVPVFPVKGQALKVKDGLHHKVHYSSICYIIPRSKYIYLGATSEVQGFNTDITLEGLRSLSENAIRLIPAMKGARFFSALVGFRPASPDDLPIFNIGENYMLLTGHHRNGILHAPLTAKLAKNYLVYAKESPYIKAFSADRFKNP